MDQNEKILSFGQKMANLPIFFIFLKDEPNEVHRVRWKQFRLKSPAKGPLRMWPRVRVLSQCGIPFSSRRWVQVPCAEWAYAKRKVYALHRVQSVKIKELNWQKSMTMFLSCTHCWKTNNLWSLFLSHFGRHFILKADAKLCHDQT